MMDRGESTIRSHVPSTVMAPPTIVHGSEPLVNGVEPIIMELPPVDRPPIYIDVPAGPVAPGLSGGRGMFKRLIVACDGMFVSLSLSTFELVILLRT